MSWDSAAVFDTLVLISRVGSDISSLGSAKAECPSNGTAWVGEGLGATKTVMAELSQVSLEVGTYRETLGVLRASS